MSIKRATFLIMIICTAFVHMSVYCAVGELLVAKVILRIVHFFSFAFIVLERADSHIHTHKYARSFSL